MNPITKPRPQPSPDRKDLPRRARARWEGTIMFTSRRSANPIFSPPCFLACLCSLSFFRRKQGGKSRRQAKARRGVTFINPTV